MTGDVVYTQPDLVDVYWREDLSAVNIVWHSEFDPGTGVKDAVLAALSFVNQNKVENWLVDISGSDEALSDKDYEWVSSKEFRDLICASSLTRFVMIPPGPLSTQDTSWISDWEANTLKNFGDSVMAKISSDQEEIRAFFTAELPDGA